MAPGGKDLKNEKMKHFLPVLLISVVVALAVPSRAVAQTTDPSTVDVKLGLGASFLGSGDILIGKLEGDLTKKWNRFISNSVSLSLGYGNDKWYYDSYSSQRTFTTHLDGNVFLSPFGNHHRYNLKLGTGLSLMYVSDAYSEGDWQFRGRPRESRASLGYSMIVEQEIALGNRSLFGLKTMIQPYMNGDIATTVMFKVGRKL